MKKMIPFTLLLLFVLGCASSKKTQEVHIECAVLYRSELKKMERVGVADTASAFLSLKIRDKNNFDDLPFSSVSLTRIGEYQPFRGTTDLEGMYATFLPAGNYELRVSYPGYDELDAQRIELKTGEIWEIEVALLGLQTPSKSKQKRPTN